MIRDLVLKHATPVPRYTSYPTSPHFDASVGNDTYRRWLGELRADQTVSAYVHIPFCVHLCWYCGCHTKGIKRYAPVSAYLDTLAAEIRTVAALASQRPRVEHIHWGGGSPDVLAPDDILRLAETLKSELAITHDAEFAVEIDPRVLTPGQVEAFAKAGVNRVSIGVQDFSPAVQKAINRIQSFDETRAAVEQFRAAGVASINIDLVYGLPNQTRDSVLSTIDQTLSLEPDRIALFGYAHLPERIPRQRLITDATLPDTLSRFAQANRVASRLTERGYVRIGFDHFAKPDDPLALAQRDRHLRRNFQGYTADSADALIAFGASAISRLPQGYAANVVAIPDYTKAIASDGLAVARGYAFAEDDRMRSIAIERLMCQLEFPAAELRDGFGDRAAGLIAQARTLAEREPDGLVEPDGDTFRVTERGRPFLRSICAEFDAHLARSNARHSSGV